jgi:hypothetical protein
MNIKIFLISLIHTLNACREGICITCYEKVFINEEKNQLAEKCGRLLRKQCCLQYLLVSNGMGLPAYGKTDCKNLNREQSSMDFFSSKKIASQEIEIELENLDDIGGDYSDTYQDDLERCAAERIASRESQGK